MKYVLALLLFAGCSTQRVKVDPVTVQPIHLTIDVNVHDAPASEPAPR